MGNIMKPTDFFDVDDARTMARFLTQMARRRLDYLQNLSQKLCEQNIAHSSRPFFTYSSDTIQKGFFEFLVSNPDPLSQTTAFVLDNIVNMGSVVNSTHPREFLIGWDVEKTPPSNDFCKFFDGVWGDLNALSKKTSDLVYPLNNGCKENFQKYLREKSPTPQNLRFIIFEELFVAATFSGTPFHSDDFFEKLNTLRPAIKNTHSNQSIKEMRDKLDAIQKEDRPGLVSLIKKARARQHVSHHVPWDHGHCQKSEEDPFVIVGANKPKTLSV